jgi:hypothetical protein
MSRPDGFNIMDVSTSIQDDPKFRRLARAHPDLWASALGLYVVLLAASWKAGDRVMLSDAWPLFLPIDPAVVAALSVELLDDEGRIPEDTWQGWYGPAQERREARRDSGRLGGRKSGAGRSEASLQRRSSAAPATLNPSDRPSTPSDRSARPREGNLDEVTSTNEPWGPNWGGFLEEWRRRYGDPPTERHRAALWEIVRDRPTDAAAWLVDAPLGCSAYQAVAHVLDRSRQFKAAIPPDPPPLGRGATLNGFAPLTEVLRGKSVLPGPAADADDRTTR